MKTAWANDETNENRTRSCMIQSVTWPSDFPAGGAVVGRHSLILLASTKESFLSLLILISPYLAVCFGHLDIPPLFAIFE